MLICPFTELAAISHFIIQHCECAFTHHLHKIIYFLAIIFVLCLSNDLITPKVYSISYIVDHGICFSMIG